MVSTREANAALVREFLTSGVASGDADTLGIFLREDAGDCRPVVEHSVNRETVGSSYWRALAAADIYITIDAVVAAEENVAVRGVLTHPHRGLPQDRVPAVNSFEVAIAWFCRIEDGHIVETWSLPDGQWLVEQLDMTPPGGT